ncbi:MAG: terpene cyclase/mutase family protein [Planctomycetes bacterium]|nr:terpene cyclase/mutase family protein [Planctomycetota bacterium]
MNGRAIVLTLLSMIGAAGVLTARADPPPSLPPLVTPETQDAIDLGLEYLARMQSRDGAWRHSGSWGGRYPTAMTALSGLTMLANGNTATQGKYAQNVSRAANFLLASAQPSGLIAREEESSSSMHGHGFAMLFLGQLCGMEEDNEKQERIAAVLRRAVELTARSQSRRGGWIYRPDSSDDEGSVTVTQLQGLRASRNVGITVPKQVIDQAMKYLDMSTLPDGGISYRADRQGGSRPPITAAAVACWYNAGLYDYPSAVKALDYCKQRVGNGEARTASFSGHYYYAHLYMAQIMWLSSKENWEWYFPTMRDWLIAQQAPDGSWEGDGVGKVYGTAVATFILQIPYGYLPILQR